MESLASAPNPAAHSNGVQRPDYESEIGRLYREHPKRLYSAAGTLLIEAAQRIIHPEVDAVMWASCLHASFFGGKWSPLQITDRGESGLREALNYLESQRAVLVQHGWTGTPPVPWNAEGRR